MKGDYGKFKVREATYLDAKFMAPRLRKQDLEYVQAGSTALESLTYGIVHGTAYTIEVDDEPVIMMGGGGDDPDFNVIWMVATPNIRKIRSSVVKYGRAFALNLLNGKPFGINAVSTSNHNVIRWLEKIGVELGETLQFEGKEFRVFEIKNNV